MSIQKGEFYKDDKFLVYVKSVRDGEAQVVGFDDEGEFSEFISNAKVIKSECQKIPRADFMDVLTAEVIKRGYTDEAKVESVLIGGKTVIGESPFKDRGVKFTDSGRIQINGITIFVDNIWGVITPKIDWSQPSKFKYCGDKPTYVVQSIGSHDGQAFSGVVIYSENENIKEGHYSDAFNKDQFEPFKGKTLCQEQK